MWATRFWWMLESLGFKRASVLDGGFEKWSGEGRPIERGSPRGYPRGTFTAAPRPGFFVDKHTVLAARNDPSAVVINALGPQFHKGLEPSRYGRPGSIGRGVTVVRVRGQLRKPKKTTHREPAAWEVYRLKSSPAAFVGLVYAEDEEGALTVTIEEYNIGPADQKRLLARPR